MPAGRPDRSARIVNGFTPDFNIPASGDTVSHPVPFAVIVLVVKLPEVLAGLNRITGCVCAALPAAPPNVNPPVENTTPEPEAPAARTFSNTDMLCGEFTAFAAMMLIDP